MLTEAGFDVVQQPLQGPERPHRNGVRIADQVSHILNGKVENAKRELDHPCVVVADTLVEDPDDATRPLGQPASPGAALSMLLRLSNRNHRVWTGTALITPEGVQTRVESATVSIEALSDAVLEALIGTGSWRGKAGGYDLAGPMGAHATLVHGAEETVLGLTPALFKTLRACE